MTFTIPNPNLDFVEDQELIDATNQSSPLNNDSNLLLDNNLANEIGVAQLAEEIIDEIDNPSQINSLERVAKDYSNRNVYQDLKNKVDSLIMSGSFIPSSGDGVDAEIIVLPQARSVTLTNTPGTRDGYGWVSAAVSTTGVPALNNFSFSENPSILIGRVKIVSTTVVAGNCQIWAYNVPGGLIGVPPDPDGELENPNPAVETVFSSTDGLISGNQFSDSYTFMNLAILNTDNYSDSLIALKVNNVNYTSTMEIIIDAIVV